MKEQMTLAEFIDMNYSGLKAKFDLSTDEEKLDIMKKLNEVLPGLGDALSRERSDLVRVTQDTDNHQEIAGALIPLTSLQGFDKDQIKQPPPSKKSKDKGKDKKKSKYKGKETSINVVQPMFVLSGADGDTQANVKPGAKAEALLYSL